MDVYIGGIRVKPTNQWRNINCTNNNEKTIHFVRAKAKIDSVRRKPVTPDCFISISREVRSDQFVLCVTFNRLTSVILADGDTPSEHLVQCNICKRSFFPKVLVKTKNLSLIIMSNAAL